MWTSTHRSTGRTSGLALEVARPVLALALVGLLPALVACNASAPIGTSTSRPTRPRANLDRGR